MAPMQSTIPDPSASRRAQADWRAAAPATSEHRAATAILRAEDRPLRATRAPVRRHCPAAPIPARARVPRHSARKARPAARRRKARARRTAALWAMSSDVPRRTPHAPPAPDPNGTACALLQGSPCGRCRRQARAPHRPVRAPTPGIRKYRTNSSHSLEAGEYRRLRRRQSQRRMPMRSKERQRCSSARAAGSPAERTASCASSADSRAHTGSSLWVRCNRTT